MKLYIKNMVCIRCKMVVKAELERMGLHHTRDDLEQASLISLLIHDIFGGEILKTRIKKGWHFYNRIEGNRVDFTNSVLNTSSDEIKFEDIPATPDETYCYFEDAEYSTFLMRFVRAFEDAVGLDKYRPRLKIS